MIRPKAGSFKRETVQCDKTNRLAACADAQIPMLFLQGTRDTLASLDQLKPLCKKLGRCATLKLFAGADHSFHVKHFFVSLARVQENLRLVYLVPR